MDPTLKGFAMAAKSGRRSGGPKPIALALYGGVHGVFDWGVLDRLLEDDRLEIEGVSATSAGAMKATVLAYGLQKGDAENAHQALHDFWSSGKLSRNHRKSTARSVRCLG